MIGVDYDKLGAVQQLILELVAARYRLGEHEWTLSRSAAMSSALTALSETHKLVSVRPGVVEKTYRVRLTNEGHALMFGMASGYEPPSVPEWRARIMEGRHLMATVSADSQPHLEETLDQVREEYWLSHVVIETRLVTPWVSPS